MDEIDDVPRDALDAVVRIFDALPEVVHVEDAWAHSFLIRRTNLLGLTSFGADDGSVTTVLSVRADEGQAAALVASGHPWFATGQPKRVGMLVDGAADWDQVEALAVAAYRAVAPKKLVALLD